MEHEQGDDYLRRLATFIRTNEKGLAEAGVTRRRRAQRPAPSEPTSYLNPLGWFGLDSTTANATSPPQKPVVLAVDTHRLFYVLMRLEAIGIDVGTLDVQVDSPSRPMSFINIFTNSDKSDTLSLASFRSSLSVVSGLSLGGGWWGRPEPPSVDTELKFLYSSFTKLPALIVKAPGRKLIAELASEPPNRNALPLDSFKNLQSLECIDIDPRTLLGWDRLAEGLRSLRISKSGVEDVSDIFIGAVVDDQARREGSTSRKRRRRIPHGPNRQTSYHTTRLPDTVPEDADEEAIPTTDLSDSTSGSPPPDNKLSSLKWAFLKHLSLPDNALTFFPIDSIPYLTSLTHLDLSSNLLVSVPPGLGSLYNLISLNLSDNMIDSVLGIYLNLGQVLTLNIAHNRLESICGLERLHALERVDLRHNLLDESAEVGRLATLPNITDIWVEGNPFVEIEEQYRVVCFDYFWKEGKSVNLDGTPPGYYERRNLTVPPPQQMSSSRPVSTIPNSPPIVAVGHLHQHHSSPGVPLDKSLTPPTSSNASPQLTPLGVVGVGGRARRKKNKRIVQLDGDNSDTSSRSPSHSRMRSDGSGKPRFRVKMNRDTDAGLINASPSKPSFGQFGSVLEEQVKTPKPQDFSDDNLPRAIPASSEPASSSTMKVVDPTKAPEAPFRPPNRSRHSRYHTEYTPSSTGFADNSSSGPIVDLTSPPASISSNVPPSFRRNRGSATFSSKSAMRRARVSASVYEPPASDGETEGTGNEIRDNADAYRKRMEALKKDMGDGWLKVFSQSQMKTPS